VFLAQQGSQVFIRQGKGQRPRTLPLNASARNALVDYGAFLLHTPADLAAVLVAWPAPQSVPLTPLWVSQKGGHLSTNAIQRIVATVVRDGARRGLVPAQASAHRLRHTFAHTSLAQHPQDILGLATLLGHASLEVTRRYCQPTLEQLAERVEVLPLNTDTD
jgi:site-specific recombinase XerD